MPNCTIIPVMEYDNVPEVIDWLCNCFGFTERWRIGDHRAQLSFEGGTIVVTANKSEEVSRQSLLVRVKNVEAHYHRSRILGVPILQTPTDFPYGERQYTAEDLNGYKWTFSQSIKDVMPEEFGGVTNQLD